MEKGTVNVIEQLPYRLPPKTLTLSGELPPVKSHERLLPITEVVRVYFERQLDLQAQQKELAELSGTVYYDNHLVVAKPNGIPFRRKTVLPILVNCSDGLSCPISVSMTFAMPRLRTCTSLQVISCYDDGSPFHPGTVSHLFENALKKNNLPKIRFHDLRYPNLYKIQTFLSKYLILLDWE